MQDLCIFSLKGLFFVSTLLRVLRQGINSFISFVLSIINPEVILEQFLNLSDVPKAQAFYIHEALEVVVVCKRENFIFVAFEIMPPSLKYFNNYTQLSIVSLIPSLS